MTTYCFTITDLKYAAISIVINTCQPCPILMTTVLTDLLCWMVRQPPSFHWQANDMAASYATGNANLKEKLCLYYSGESKIATIMSPYVFIAKGIENYLKSKCDFVKFTVFYTKVIEGENGHLQRDEFNICSCFVMLNSTRDGFVHSWVNQKMAGGHLYVRLLICMVFSTFVLGSRSIGKNQGHSKANAHIVLSSSSAIKRQSCANRVKGFRYHRIVHSFWL